MSDPKHADPNQLQAAENDAVNKKSNFSSCPDDDDADHPPDSYALSKDAELDWFVRNAFFERNYSTKASNSNSASASLVPKQLKKSDSSIIWIPKTQIRRSSFPETKLRRPPPPPIRLVPRRSDVVVVNGGGKTTEPSSPKVSCTGRVRQRKNKPAKNQKSKKTKTKMPSNHHRRKSSGTLWTRLRDVFRSGKLRAQSVEVVVAPAMRWRSKSSRVQQSSLGEPVPASLTRFASGRKSDSWITGMKTAIEEVDTLRSDQTRRIELWSRRNLEAPEPVDCSRDWLDSGPASV